MMLFLAATAVMALLGGDVCGAASTGVQNLSTESKFVIPLTKGKRPRLPGSVHKENLKWDQDAYLGDITVGNPPQTVTVGFDTTYDNLWVLTDNHQVGCKLQDGSDRCYYVAKSHTHGRTNHRFLAKYGTGEAYGFWTTDDANVAGQQIVQMIIGVGNKLDQPMAETMKSSRFSGVAGLAMGLIGGIIYHLKNSTHMEKKVFSMKLSSDSDNYIMFGGWDEKIVSEKDIKWVPVTNRSIFRYLFGIWEFLVPRVDVGGTEVWNSDDTMIADTGCTLNRLKTELFDNIVKELGASQDNYGVMVMPAADEHKLKDITFTINGSPYTLKPADYIVGKENGTLILGFQRSPIMDPGVSCMLCHPFLRKFYSIFDFEKQRIAFASYPGKQ